MISWPLARAHHRKAPLKEIRSTCSIVVKSTAIHRNSKHHTNSRRRALEEAADAGSASGAVVEMGAGGSGEAARLHVGQCVGGKEADDGSYHLFLEYTPASRSRTRWLGMGASSASSPSAPKWRQGLLSPEAEAATCKLGCWGGCCQPAMDAVTSKLRHRGGDGPQ